MSLETSKREIPTLPSSSLPWQTSVIFVDFGQPGRSLSCCFAMIGKEDVLKKLSETGIIKENGRLRKYGTILENTHSI
jgi:hypothetical protein